MSQGTLRWLRTHTVPRFELESGAVLRDLRQAYYLDGTLSPERDNVVVVFHALTGSADAAGSWWAPLIGPGRAIDTREYAVLAPNLVGSCYGSTGPGDFPAGEFPAITTRDQARAVHLLLQELGVERPALLVGGSLGGMVALEHLATFPDAARSAAILAAPAAHPAFATGWNHVQRELLAFGTRGLELARQVAMLSFRSAPELALRFGRDTDDAGRFEVRNYLEHQGVKLARRFDAATYRVLLDAMDTHDVGRGRGGVATALRRSAAAIVAAGIPGDLLYPADEVREWAEAAGAEYREIHSIHGHDAFLLEPAQVGRIIRAALHAGAPALELVEEVA